MQRPTTEEPEAQAPEPRGARLRAAVEAGAEEARDRSRARPAFLAHASRLLASSLDYENTLATVAGLALPELGAWCIVDVVEADGAVRRLSIVHPDPRMQERARRLVDGWPPEREDPIGAPVVMRTHRSEVIPHVTDSLLERMARGEENLRLLRALGLGPVIVVPLLAREHVLGAMTFIAPRGTRLHPDENLALAEDLAARCALAVDNARLSREAEQARRDAERAERARSQFLAVSSHEIRTPINAIIGYAQLLEMGLSGPLTAPQREQLERIHASGQHLLGLVNEILDLAKVEAGQMVVQHEPGHLAEAVRAACDAVHAQAAACRVTLDRRCGSGSRAFYVGDPDRVRQILVNLLANACKFSDPGGRVEVRCGVTERPAAEARLGGEGPWAFVEVSDSGIGIAEEQQTRIFDPFIQVSEGHTRTREGTGLGLAIARQLARLMGGDLSVRSALGRGSAFTLWLPADRGAAEGEPRERRRFDREADGLGALGRVLTRRGEPILRAYVRRLRADPRIPDATRLSDAALRNHVLGFLSELGQMLRLAHERGGAASVVLRDGSKIQQVIAQLHGVQRRVLGWDEEALQRDFELLREAIAHEARAADPAGEEGMEAALEVLARIVEQATRTSLRAWRLTSPGG